MVTSKTVLYLLSSALKESNNPSFCLFVSLETPVHRQPGNPGETEKRRSAHDPEREKPSPARQRKFRSNIRNTTILYYIN